MKFEFVGGCYVHMWSNFLGQLVSVIGYIKLEYTIGNRVRILFFLLYSYMLNFVIIYCTKQ